jgi:glutamyl-Q tRNA(Asp) synthetase
VTRPDLARLPNRPTTRFAPAPTGYLHLGHVVNAIYVWGLARISGGRVVLRVEDHDRGRCRPEYEAAMLDDLDWLGFVPDEPSTDELRHGPSAYRQSDSHGVHADALDVLRGSGLAYACDCSRTTFGRWAETHGRAWSGPGCPGDCRARGLAPGPGIGERVGIGTGEEAFEDLLLGSQTGDPSETGDLLVRERSGSWTYAFAVVVDDLRHGVDLVVRGRDLLPDTPRQIRLGRLLGRARPPAFAHHPLVLRQDGSKLSKASRDTSVRELRDAGWNAQALIGHAAAAVGLVDRPVPITADAVAALFGSAVSGRWPPSCGRRAGRGP